jgi:hypothetical protein
VLRVSSSKVPDRLDVCCTAVLLNPDALQTSGHGESTIALCHSLMSSTPPLFPHLHTTTQCDLDC